MQCDVFQVSAPCLHYTNRADISLRAQLGVVVGNMHRRLPSRPTAVSYAFASQPSTLLFPLPLTAP